MNLSKKLFNFRWVKCYSHLFMDFSLARTPDILSDQEMEALNDPELEIKAMDEVDLSIISRFPHRRPSPQDPATWRL